MNDLAAAIELRFESVAGLPRLSWCAVFESGASSARILHGPWVETGPGCFVEGAWDGPYDGYGFDRAVTFTGSGGRVSARGVIFSSPTHNLERLFSLRTGSTLLVSNSLAMVAAMAGDGLDLTRVNYFFDVLRHYRQGLRVRNKTLFTRSGNQVHCHECANILVRRDLEVVRLEKDFGTAPATYDEYVSYIDTTIGSVMANARHRARRRRFEPITAISRGYDSAAVSALAARNGCTRAVTFRYGGDRRGRLVRDDGAQIAPYLGLSVSSYDKRDLHRFPDSVQGPAELFTNPYLSTEQATQLMESEVEGRLFLSGRHGEHFWDTDPLRALPWFQEPTTLGMAGANATDMRLRIGYMHYPAPYTLGVYAPALLRISRSAAMAPWRIGGTYDRPIPRRLLESAGVPRELFGQQKIGGIGNAREDKVFPARWEKDFIAYYHDKVPPEIRAGLVDEHLGRVPYWEKGRMADWERWLRTRPGLIGIVPRLLGDRRHQRWRSRYLYAFHWGFEHTSRRYSKKFIDDAKHLDSGAAA